MTPSPSPTDDRVERLEKQKQVYVRALRNTTRELENKIQELGILRQLGQLFERSTRLEEVAEHALPMLLRSSGAENASIMILSRQTGELSLLAALGREQAKLSYYGIEGYPERYFRSGEGIAGCCLAEGRPILAEDARLDSRFLPEWGHTKVGCLACLPLSSHENPMGVVNLSHPSPRSLDSRRMPVWTILASYLAIALSNALLFKELKESNRRLWDRVRNRTRSLEAANKQLQEAKAQVARHNEMLQERVRERTAELEAALQELQAQHAQLEEANRVKDEFLNNINHELKTPLNAIIGYAGLLMKEARHQLPEEQRADLRLIEANGKHLQQVLESILTLKDIERGTVELERASTDLNALIDSVVASLRPLAQVRGIEMGFEPGDLAPAAVDPTLIRRVLFNLLDNAIKFSSGGHVAVRARPAERDPDSPQRELPSKEGGAPFAVVEIQDEGPGIRQEDLEHIFQKFRQGEPPTRKKQGGSGVGLAIAKNLVELHGGRIWVTSHPGAGSTFSFCIPLER